MKPIEVTWPPALFTGQDGKRYAISGQYWVEVPADTTFGDLPEYMVVKLSAARPTDTEKSWEVLGSTGKSYTVTLKNGRYSCTCAGFGWRQKCKHAEAQKNASR